MIRDLFPTLKGFDKTLGLNANTKHFVELKSDIYDIVDRVFELCKQITDELRESEEIRKSYNQATEKKAEDSILMELTQKNSKINLLFNEANNEVLKIRDAVNEDLKADPDCNEPSLRMRNLISKGLQAKIYTLIKVSQKNQLEVKVTVQEKISRQLKIYDPSMTPEQIQIILKEPNKVEAIIKEKMYASSHPKIQSAINGIKEKLAEIEELERNVLYLYKMIEELSIIIKAQSELVLSIEANMKAVRDFIDSGIKNFEKAKEDYMKKQEIFCMILIGLIVVGIIGVGYGMSQLNII
jgi:t-SNARE complex subunit (syntaxin)